MASTIHYPQMDSFLPHHHYVDNTSPTRLRGDPAKFTGSTLVDAPTEEDSNLTLSMNSVSSIADPLAAVMHTGSFYDPWHCNYMDEEATHLRAASAFFKYSGLSDGLLHHLPSTSTASDSNVAESSESISSGQAFSDDGSSPTIAPAALLAYNNPMNAGDAEDDSDELTATPSDNNSDDNDNDDVVSTNNKKRRRSANDAEGNNKSRTNNTPTSPHPKRRHTTTNLPINTNTNSNSNSNNTSSIKRERFLEKNRAAAHRCRQKKKKWAVDMDDQCRELKARNASLQLHIAQLNDEAYGLKMLLLQHGDCGFPPIMAYIEETAEGLVQHQLRRRQQQKGEEAAC
ncbi:uncharacterized protein K452DRAFT_291976 [Aplosporella prunicola CBS 121167]|uniref:BZIP domain-containing protein n=1 Tax=Aplosporella prunicola CBS 121167 TaxID=1176127 RepID=A0A6A6AYD3_9PEZI|nr:uncharacterized protein K452DRAFT_291976 [Aplosporella prunicola CBS 121167]KAF2136939.1 hypothetical protein K452DRAFT_291976 [Aplosporella prunicola CBS 121167]